MEEDCSNRSHENELMQLPWYEEDSYERIPISDPVWTVEKAAAFFKQKFLSLNTETGSTDNVTLLPNNILNAQTCTRCLNYLSIGPVRIKSNSEIICGRRNCAESNFLPNSLYNILAEQYDFKCVHHYNGCKVVTSYSEEMKNHEDLCKFEHYYICPYFECKFLGNGCQLIQHYKRCHLNSLAEDCVFNIEKNSGLNKILCPLDDDLVIIYLNCVGEKLRVESSHSRRKDKNYCFIIFSPKININYISDSIDFGNYLEIDLGFTEKQLNSNILFGGIRINTKHVHTKEGTSKANNDYKYSVSRYKSINDNFTKVFKQLLNIFSKTVVKCCNCNQQIINKNDISICPQSHFSCICCLKDYCKQCETNCKNEWINVKMEYENVSVYCDWPKCNKKIKCLQFINHKQICCKRQYHCPKDSCQFKGNREELLNHWYDCNSAPLKFGKVLDFSLKETNDIYWITDELHEMLHINVVRDGGTYIKVYETSAIFPKNYEIDLFLENKDFYYKYKTLLQRDITKSNYYNLKSYPNVRLIIRTINNSVLDEIPDTVITKDDQPTFETVIKQIMNIFFKLPLNCHNCKSPIKINDEIYICNIESHISCKHCSISRCEGCNSDTVQFISLNSIFSNLPFSCDWSGCNERTTYLEYLRHKQRCPKRHYECPIGCERDNNKLKVTTEELQEHFYRIHDINLQFNTNLNFEINDITYQMYWVPENVKELLVVSVNVFRNNCRLEICEKYAVFSNNYKIELYQYDKYKMHFKKIDELKQFGSIKKYPKSLYGDQMYRLTLVSKIE